MEAAVLIEADKELTVDDDISTVSVDDDRSTDGSLFQLTSFEEQELDVIDDDLSVQSVQSEDTIIYTVDGEVDSIVSQVEAERYFGDCGRRRFYEQTQFVKQKRNIGISKPFKLIENKKQTPDRPKVLKPLKSRFQGPPSTSPKLRASTVLKIKKLGDRMNDCSEIDDTLREYTESLRSPRSRFIDSCLEAKINPRASFLIRQQLSKNLRLAHLGIGDSSCLILTQSLSDLPLMNSIDVSDNNLTDKSLAPLMSTLSAMGSIESLNISQNRVGLKTSSLLAQFLSSTACPLRVLQMSHADVDDAECGRFISAMFSHGTSNVKEIDLSNNKIGSSETVNSATSTSTQTGAEVLAEFVKSKGCQLQTLQLRFNSIRMRSALALTTSLTENTTLTFLDLSYNGLGNAAGMQIGKAIKLNKNLKTLLISDAGIGAKACFSICMGVIDNESVKKVNLNGNPIGREGAEAVMKVPMHRGKDVSVTYSGCSTVVTDMDFNFNPASPCRSYTLDLASPFDHSLAQELLVIAAWHPTITLSQFNLDGEDLELIQFIVKKTKALREDEDELLKDLRYLENACDNKGKFETMYNVGADLSETVSEEECHNILRTLDPNFTHKQTQGMLRLYDIDSSGMMTMGEILRYVQDIRKDVQQRIQEITHENPAMGLAPNPTKRYPPPFSGCLRIELSNPGIQKEHFRSMSSLDRSYVHSVAMQCEKFSSMVTHAVNGTKLRSNEAYALYESMIKDSGQKHETVCTLLPHIIGPEDVHRLIHRVASGEVSFLKMLKVRLGWAYYPLLGYYDRHYSLDLSVATSRQCLKVLLEVSNSQAASIRHSSGGRVGDLSQDGNWSLFRNATLDGAPTVISSEIYGATEKTTGKLDFDFFSWERKSVDEMATVSSGRIVELMRMCCLISLADAMLGASLIDADVSLDDVSITHNLASAHEIATTINEFYEMLPKRYAEELKSHHHEILKNDQEHPAGEGRPGSKDSKHKSVKIGAHHKSIKPHAAAQPPAAGEKSAAGSTDSAASPMSVAGGLSKQELEKKELYRQFHFMIEVAPAVRCSHILEHLDESLNRSWLTIRQLKFIMKKFEFGKIDHTPFGSFRVELLTRLFGRLVDVDRIDDILQLFTTREVAHCIARIGRLKLLNPATLIGPFHLNLARREERMVAKILVTLATREAGINLRNEEFRWEPSDAPVGFVVSEQWLRDEGVPHRGLLTLEYVTVAGDQDADLRELLCGVVLARNFDSGRRRRSSLAANEEMVAYFYPTA